jgi:hypothetical protein
MASGASAKRVGIASGWHRSARRGSLDAMVRACVVSLLVLATACPGPGTAVTSPGGGGPGTGSGGPRVGGGSGTGKVDGGGDVTIDNSCPAPGCVYHGGIVGGAYFTCLSAGAGSCFHFGARCAPADGCMFDAASKAYRHCDAPSEGACATYGKPCQPAGGCAFDPSDGLHRSCEAWSSGACTRWGAVCKP